MFLNDFEKSLTADYLENGYIKQIVADQEALDWIRKQYIELIQTNVKVPQDLSPDQLLNQIHEYVRVSDLNQFRLHMIH